MYEKIVGYFESNWCIDNIYFMKNYKLWLIGGTITISLELVLNSVFYTMEDVFLKLIVIFLFDSICTVIFFAFIYAKPICKIYKQKLKRKVKLDWIKILMNEDELGWYRESEISEMNKYLKEVCKIHKPETIELIISMIDEEIKNKYTVKSFFENYFPNIILPILILILTIYFTNNAEKNFTTIFILTFGNVLLFAITLKIIAMLQHINLTPVRKKDNLLELKRVLQDILIEWKK